MENKMNNGEKAVLSQIQLGHYRVAQREATITKRKEEQSLLKPHFDRYNEINEELKELKSENRSDREFVKKSIEFYESATGEAAGLGPLFTEEGEN